MRSQHPAAEPQFGVLVLTAPAGARTLAEALRRLDAAGIAPDDVALRKPTLDEVFLTLTLTGRATAAPNSPALSGAASGDPDHTQRPSTGANR